MNKFYDWFEHKGYKKIFDTTTCRECQKEYLQSHWMTDQMLIGYMQEYLMEVHNIFVDFPFSPFHPNEKYTITDYYNRIVEEIKRLDKKLKEKNNGI
jgi:predicted DNA-binding transcriptional regulator